jgi:threonine aldolase
MSIIDLRSDTVTRPTPEMRTSMYNALVGDDVYNEDTTIQRLEDRVATIFNKESALFFPSGTMSNLTALLTWCPNRGAEIIVGDKSHIFLFEQASASQFGGISPRSVPNLSDGTMDINLIKEAIRENDIHEPITSLICIENTHNVCGGKIIPLSFLQQLKILANENNIPIHLDGARIWNAITASNINPQEISNNVDSLSVCLSKGLGAPIGSLLVGPREFINKARRIRKALGGGMRQVGILGAAGLKAIDDFEDGILVNDHKRCQKLVAGIKVLQVFKVNEPIHTNIIFINIVSYNKSNKNNICINSTTISKMASERGILISAWSPFLIRLVIHRDMNDADIDYTVSFFKETNNFLLNLEYI